MKALTETEAMQARVMEIDADIFNHTRQIELLRIDRQELQDTINARVNAASARQELEKQAGVIPIAMRAK